MKILIVGAGAAGVTSAINLKRNNPNSEVLIIEHLDKPLKKILATGNGKCNLGNTNLDFNLYNNPFFAKKIISGFDFEDFFESISIKTKTIGDLAYPISESAISVREAFLKECKKLGIKISVEEKLLDYVSINNRVIVTTNKNEYEVDKLVLAGGLKSSPKLGSDGSVIEILKKHKYQISNLNPGLSPLFTKEKTKSLDGIRCKASVSLYSKGKLIHKEDGEVLFKEHGLSGIVIFNMMSFISRNESKDSTIKLDLLPDYDHEYLKNYLNKHSLDELLLAFVNPKISEFIKNISKTSDDIINNIKNLTFTFDKSYGFDFSQVTVGGVEITDINDSLESKIEKNVYIVGELLNIDGPCGGYNLTWAFASGWRIK